MKIFLICLLLLSSFIAQSRTVIYQGAYCSDAKYEELIAKTNGATTPIDSQMKKLAPTRKMERLKNLAVMSQKAFLMGQLENSKKLFKDIAAMAYEEHWAKIQRMWIHYAFLRLHQIDEASEKWLKKAIDFDPSLSPNTKVFHPDIQKQFTEIKEQHNEVKVSLPFEFSDYKAAIVNGIPQMISAGVLRIPSRNAKVSLLSNKRKTIQWRDHIKLPGEFWPDGKCLEEMKTHLASKPIGAAINEKKGLSKVLLKPRPAQAKTNYWLWAGGIAAGFLFYQSQNKKSSRKSQSTSRDGF